MKPHRTPVRVSVVSDTGKEFIADGFYRADGFVTFKYKGRLLFTGPEFYVEGDAKRLLLKPEKEGEDPQVTVYRVKSIIANSKQVKKLGKQIQK